jgi:NAD(P)H-flavin reductase
LNLYFTVSTVQEVDWNQGVGHITKEMLKNNLPPPSSETIILICGPHGLEKLV